MSFHRVRFLLVGLFTLTPFVVHAYDRIASVNAQQGVVFAKRFPVASGTSVTTVTVISNEVGTIFP